MQPDAIRAIAFYLPQFHAIPENDAWWGPGFTEWVNVRAATPLFPGHRQPQTPHRSIGYYDLTDRAFLRRQRQLAARYGIHGFCYYHYWFDGRTLLDAPLRIVSRSPEMDQPFCLCWANGPWTRAWYGQSREALIENSYGEGHAAAFFENVLPYLADPRYIRVDGRPLLLVYQVHDIPEPAKWARVWREMARERGLGELYLASVEALLYGADPAEYGFDGAVEFAPDWTRAARISKDGESPRLFDYVKTAAGMIAKPLPGYERFPCVFPGWDNAPRYKKAAVCFVNGSPGAFKYFLTMAARRCRETLPPGRRLLFINAWNEWGEGCHLEPSEEDGFVYLRVVKEVLNAEGAARP